MWSMTGNDKIYSKRSALMMDSNGCADSVNTKPTLTITVPVRPVSTGSLPVHDLGQPKKTKSCMQK